jgi:hypothetical protein
LALAMPLRTLAASNAAAKAIVFFIEHSLMFSQAPLSGSRRAHISTVSSPLEHLVCIPHGKQEKNLTFAQIVEKASNFFAHNIINSGNFLLIGRLSKRRCEACLPMIARRPGTVLEAIEAWDFDGKSFPALLLGQGLHGRG